MRPAEPSGVAGGTGAGPASPCRAGAAAVSDRGEDRQRRPAHCRVRQPRRGLPVTRLSSRRAGAARSAARPLPGRGRGAIETDIDRSGRVLRRSSPDRTRPCQGPD